MRILVSAVTAITFCGCGTLPGVETFFEPSERAVANYIDVQLEVFDHQRDDLNYRVPAPSAYPSTLPGDEAYRNIQSIADLSAALNRGLTEHPDEDECKSLKPRERYRRVSRFLHISDAQIRDERLYGADDQYARMQSVDRYGFGPFKRPFLDSTIRPVTVERFDSLLYAAFLTAYADAQRDNAADAAETPFIIHTGDLLDASVTSEFYPALRIMREVAIRYPELPLYSVGGNHDGQTFGNIRDQFTNTWGLGINKTEFVLGSLALDPGNGFGFASNESVQTYYQFGKGSGFPWDDVFPATLASAAFPYDSDKEVYRPFLNDLEPWWYRVHKQVDDIRDARQHALIWYARRLNTMFPSTRLFISPYMINEKKRATVDPAFPHDFKHMINVGTSEDFRTLRLGYYSFIEQPTSAEDIPIRHIVLDTRAEFGLDGTIDLIQLGWLYNELWRSYVCGEIVVLYAHHDPRRLALSPMRNVVTTPGNRHRQMRSAKILENMLDRFPHVVGAFFGHRHDNVQELARLTRSGRKLAFVQTGAVVDYPQVAREVVLNAQNIIPDKAENAWRVQVDWRYVYPRARGHSPVAASLARVFEQTERDARKDKSDGRKHIPSRKHWIEKQNEQDIPLPVNVESGFPVGAGIDQLDWARDQELAPEQIFGNALETVKALRAALHLAPVEVGTCDCE